MIVSCNVILCVDYDEKEKYDPSGFRDAILQGFAEAGSDLDAVHKFLDAAGSKLDYRRYGEVIFDILLAGGILGFSAENRQKLARVLAVLIAGGQVPASVLQSALQDPLEGGLALQA
ncbi:hypothetical protein HPB52_025521 [Rhipicephalus sanguineus]|uniref:5MP1/2-like HEAT domain-containing protein n=1 Tax=Rhipicephalus sanguineus TaxID=34632 RepID=A0A9D4TCV9_RHISA|nr:hypothetical protein HPB52_025521 [Rhipicephalus sanguineus]